MPGERGEVSIGKEVRQGCSLSPTLFNLYSENAINEMKDEIKNIGSKVQGKTIKMFRFADNITLLSNTERELEEALNVTETVFIKYNMKINTGKTKVITCRTQPVSELSTTTMTIHDIFVKIIHKHFALYDLFYMKD